MTLRIGISARLWHNPPPGLGVPTKRLQFLESGMAQWIMSHGVVALMIPFVDQKLAPHVHKRLPLRDLVDNLDGLVLQGGIDVHPQFYGAKPWQAQAEYDTIRDEYELDLLRGFIDAGKPVLGICRGCQLLNVYFGGTLIQDIPSQWPGAVAHTDDVRYDRLVHEVHFMPGSRLAAIYGYDPRHITSLHHQCVDKFGKDMVLEARSPIDLVPEGIRHTGHSFVVGVQWHPEFHLMNGVSEILDSGPLMMAFLKAAMRRAGHVRRLVNEMARVRDAVS
ncbi:MAG: gamma-glutamyl-gamma-aminobutyrate hydrolase family protein [Burkholderiaceae bacterium]|jgi:putative glutamine amidotransferase|nr:gamma-glutamyl-gamma-aminobutyrate hydrolase family protein [Burkholderiaceae bacterium]